ncbi:MAG: hypothetical protein RRY20_08875 [Bilophila sp.]
MIEGLKIRCKVGGIEVLRSPHISLVSSRQAVVSRAELDVPDPNGAVWSGLALGDAVTVRFGYRGESALWHEWEGTVDGRERSSPDTVRVRAIGKELCLLTTHVTESFYREPASIVAARLLARTGLPVADVDIPDELLPHQLFSGVTVARAIKQLSMSLNRSFGHDFSKHALWLGADGLRWSDGDEPGDVYTIETAENLLSHVPPAGEGSMGVVTSVLLPGLQHSRKIRIRDARLDEVRTVRAQEVRHELAVSGNKTTVLYGADRGWG